MELHILGPLEVQENGRPVAIRGGRERALLALLALHRNRALTSDRILEALWDGAPPPTAAKVVQNLVFATRVRGGLIGDFGFDAHGDPDPGLDAILRVTGGVHTTTQYGTEGSVAERVVAVPPDGFTGRR